MSYSNFKGVPIDVSACWPQYIGTAQQHAEEINRVIDKYPDATRDLARRFQKAMQDTKGRGHCPFIPGHDPVSNQVLADARNLMITKTRHQQQMEMMKLRMEMMAMMRQGQQVPQVIIKQIETAAAAAPASTAAEASQVSDSVKALQAELDKLKREQEMAKEGGATQGTDKTKKELLAAREHQDFFMRSSKKPGANIHWKSWERLKTKIPADFNEQKYLANNPDVAAAVKQGAMPSGAYHYAMYGMGPGCHASLDPSGKGKCDRAKRSFQGYRRPGYLSGVFSNWEAWD